MLRTTATLFNFPALKGRRSVAGGVSPRNPAHPTISAPEGRRRDIGHTEGQAASGTRGVAARCRALLTLAIALGTWSALTDASQDDEIELLRTDSKAPYVHRITLYDHDGTAIDPEDKLAGPYSPAQTCGKCHPVAQIAGGWHFNAWNQAVPPGRPGEPWFLVDETTGTVLPISGRGWPGTFKPEEVGLSRWDFVMEFGHHMPGGGYGEPSDEDVDGSEKAIRWGISGNLEIDCMFCHAADQQHDPSEQARQIEKENLKWAPTAALGLAVIRGEARKAPDDWDPMMPPDPDFPEKAGPRLMWDQSRFDPDGRVLLNITRRPPAERCLFCHFAREVGPESPEPFQTAPDVHLTAGLTCVDCHRNGVDHNIVRGYRTEATERQDPAVAAFSCEGCHLGATGVQEASVALGGRYGAPRPEHEGLPPHHFEKLTCTTCHSGPWPEMYAKRFQTALAHGLGLATRERKDDDPPHIVGPVFARQHDGKIAPQRMVLGTPREVSGQSVPEESNLARAYYRWSIAHNVRPASQSLGARGCEDCHSNEAPIHFGRVTEAGDEHADERPIRFMYELRGDDATFAKAWNLGFVFRPVFKGFGFICAGVIALVALHYLLNGVGAITRRFR